MFFVKRLEILFFLVFFVFFGFFEVLVKRLEILFFFLFFLVFCRVVSIFFLKVSLVGALKAVELPEYV